MNSAQPVRDLSILPVALYARLSQNPDGTKESTATQVAIGLRIAGVEWPGREVIVFTDDDLTAADANVFRPGYEDMLDSVRKGKVGLVLAKNQERISRHELIWPIFKNTCTTAGINVLHTFESGSVKTVDIDDDSLGADIQNLINAYYVKKTKRNIRLTLNQRAIEGRPTGGRSFGYAQYRNVAGQSVMVPEPGAAIEVRKMAQSVLAGASLASIVRDLNERGVPTSRGGVWSTTTVKTLLSSPTIAGLRVHQQVIVGDGNWEPLIDQSMWYAVTAALNRSTTVTRSDGVRYERTGVRRPARKYLLTGGTALCGRCGAGLVAQQRRGRTHSSKPAYLCSSIRGGCNGLGILAEPLEAMVVDKFLAKLECEKFREFLEADDGTAAERDRLEQERQAISIKRKKFAVEAVMEGVSLEMVKEMDDAFHAKEAGFEAALDALPRIVQGFDPDQTSLDWPYMPLNEQRSTLFRFDATVIVFPATPGTKGFDEGRVDVWFSGDAPSARSRCALALRNAPAT